MEDYDIILKQLKFWPMRKLLINKIKSGAKHIESDPETDKRHLFLLENWKKLTEEQKIEFAKEIYNSKNYAEGMSKATQFKDKLVEVPKLGWRKGKQAIKDFADRIRGKNNGSS